MKRKLLSGLLLLVFYGNGLAQENGRDYRNFPINLSIQFQNFSLPFKKPSFSFSNVGIGIGTEVSHSSAHDWVQGFTIWWSHNKNMGNGLYFLTQTAWRPYLANPVFGEIKAGIGYKIGYRPSEGFYQKNGKWISSGNKGKGMLAIPIGIGLGSHSYSSSTYVSPFASYQFMLIKNMNKDIPWSPETVMQFGLRTHLTPKKQ